MDTVIETYMASDPEVPTTLHLDAGRASMPVPFRPSREELFRGHGELLFTAVPNYESPADGNGDNDYEVTVKL